LTLQLYSYITTMGVNRVIIDEYNGQNDLLKIPPYVTRTMFSITIRQGGQ
jgi:hypothetical protein